LAQRGRKPKPVELKQLQGNPGKRALPKNQPRPKPGAPTRPGWLLPEAKREWTRVVAELKRLKMLTVVDRAALAGYCQAFARAVQAERALTEQGTTYETDTGQIKARPEMMIAMREWIAVRMFCEQFGLTPSSRARLDIRDPSGDGDPFEEWLRSGSHN
jgi:P27 family predicted phage terminase small subunit